MDVANRAENCSCHKSLMLWSECKKVAPAEVSPCEHLGLISQELCLLELHSEFSQ